MHGSSGSTLDGAFWQVNYSYDQYELNFAEWSSALIVKFSVDVKRWLLFNDSSRASMGTVRTFHHYIDPMFCGHNIDSIVRSISMETVQTAHSIGALYEIGDFVNRVDLADVRRRINENQDRRVDPGKFYTSSFQGRVFPVATAGQHF